jgi:hypothetical protein
MSSGEHTLGESALHDFFKGYGSKTKEFITSYNEKEIELPIVVIVTTTGCTCCEWKYGFIEAKNTSLGPETIRDALDQWNSDKKNLYLFVDKERKMLGAAFY